MYSAQLIVILLWCYIPLTYEYSISKGGEFLTVASRIHKCECGLKIDKDYNAVINTHIYN